MTRIDTQLLVTLKGADLTASTAALALVDKMGFGELLIGLKRFDFFRFHIDSDAAPETVVDTLIDQEAFQTLFKLNQWNDVVIIARGNHIQHYLNNRLILDFTDNDPKLALLQGIIALQLHAGNPMWTEFKDVRIKEFE